MGRKTWESLPIKPLPKRKNIILSSKKQKGGVTYHSLDECLTELNNKAEKKIFIIGGRSIYKLFFNFADYLHISFIDKTNKNINEFFPFKIDEVKKQFKQINSYSLSKEATYTYWTKINY